MVFGDVDFVGAASFGTNANFSGTVLSQGAVSIGAIHYLQVIFILMGKLRSVHMQT